MLAAVIGFRRIPSGVAWTTAFVPSSMWNCRRSHAGITTWPLVVNHTESVFVAFTVYILTFRKDSVNVHIIGFCSQSLMIQLSNIVPENLEDCITTNSHEFSDGRLTTDCADEHGFLTTGFKIGGRGPPLQQDYWCSFV